MMENCSSEVLLENLAEYRLNRKRSEGRLKNYSSNNDIRTWSQNKYERQEHIQEFIAGSNTEVLRTSSLPSASVLAGALLAENNVKILKLQEIIDEQGKETSFENDTPSETAVSVQKSGVAIPTLDEGEDEISGELTTTIPESEALAPESDEEKEKISVLKVEANIPDSRNDIEEVKEDEHKMVSESEEEVSKTESGDDIEEVKEEEEGKQNEAISTKQSEQIAAEQNSEEKQATEDTTSRETEQNKVQTPLATTIQKQEEVKSLPTSVIQSLLLKQANTIRALDDENLELKEILQGIKEERDLLRDQLTDLDGIETDAKMLKEKIKRKSTSTTDTEKLQHRDFGKEELLLKQLLDHNNAKRVFLEAHLAKLKCILQAIITFEKDRERLALAAQESEALRDELNVWKERALEVEENLDQAGAMIGHSKELEERIEMLERELDDALRRESELKEELDNEKKMRSLKPRSFYLEENLIQYVEEKQTSNTDGNQWEIERENLIRERDGIAKILQDVEKERDSLKKREEDSQNRWKTAVDELQETVAAQEAEKKRMSLQLEKLMDEEELNLRRESNREELKEWRKSALEIKQREEKYRNDVEKLGNAFQSQIGSLHEVILVKDQELDKMNNEISKLKDIVKSLEEKREALELAVRLLQKEKETMQEKEKTAFEEEKINWEQEHQKSQVIPTELEIDVEFCIEDSHNDYKTLSTREVDWKGNVINSSRKVTSIYGKC